MLKCSHILFKVNNLQEAFEDFSKQGFTVSWGSAKEKAHNAFIWFEEGPFIELFELPSFLKILALPLRLLKGRSAGSRWKKWGNAPEGLCDIALEPTDDAHAFDLTVIHEKLLSKGLSPSKIIKGKRVRPDGQKVHYNFILVSPYSLPFVVSLHDPPQRPTQVVHENGATGISKVTLALTEPNLQAYQKLCEDDPWIQTLVRDRECIEQLELNGLSTDVNERKIYGIKPSLIKEQ